MSVSVGHCPFPLVITELNTALVFLCDGENHKPQSTGENHKTCLTLLPLSHNNNASLLPLRARQFSRMENEPHQDEMEDLTQDFARYYTTVERETRQETMYREAAPHGRTPRQALLGGDQEIEDARFSNT